jgi:hypothetical protein
MSVIAIELVEGFCNRMSQYAFARAYAEKFGCQLQTNRWMGQKVFQIGDPPIEKPLPVREEHEIDKWMGETDIRITGWAQHQRALLYSRADARRWFTFRPEILELLKPVPHFPIAAHLRRGDFVGHNNFITISKTSYLEACDRFGVDRRELKFICEEYPLLLHGFEPSEKDHTRGTDDSVTGLGFLPDFYALMQADILFRSNSTFGYWAAVLGNAKRIFSPNLVGIPHTGERPIFQHVPFVEGNHMALGTFDEFHSELHLRES